MAKGRACAGRADALGEKGAARKSIERELRAYLGMDLQFSSGRILGSMCTGPHPLARRAHSDFIEANLGNPRLYPGTQIMHDQVVKMLASLLHGSKVSGFLVNGGTEANITALWIARNASGGKKILVAKSAHFSFLKACDLLGLVPLQVGLDRHYRMDPAQAAEMLQENDDIAAVVGVAGTTELGAVDPIAQLSKICAGRAHLHVDAAFGGFILPFLDERRRRAAGVRGWDFSEPGVMSMTIDPHKMGLATIPAGGFLFRNSVDISKIAVPTPYLTSESHYALSGTKASGAVAGAYAAMRLMGRSGYRGIVARCLRATDRLARGAREAGLRLALDPPPLNVLGFLMEDPVRVQRELAREGWQVSSAYNPRCTRVVVMPHVTEKAVDAFLPRLVAAARKFGEL